jgi:hypothetical protein
MFVRELSFVILHTFALMTKEKISVLRPGLSLKYTVTN